MQLFETILIPLSDPYLFWGAACVSGLLVPYRGKWAGLPNSNLQIIKTSGPFYQKQKLYPQDFKVHI